MITLGPQAALRMNHFEFDPRPNLPRLSWCAHVTKGSSVVRVVHGPGVETTADFFAEGAWNGPYTATSLCDATLCFATGGALVGEGTTFVTPHHTLGRLHGLRRGDTYLMSNSLLFLCVESGAASDLDFDEIARTLWTIKRGPFAARSELVIRGDVTIDLFYYCNVVVGPDLTVRKQAKQDVGGFKDFAAYRTCLIRLLRDTAANAGDAGRTTAYAPVATLSSGYDSTACAALSLAIGCEEALTFVDPTHPEEPDWDSGAVAAKSLGLVAHAMSRVAYRSRTDCPEAEFLACGTGGEDVFLAVAEDRLRDRLVLTGVHGDMAWSYPAKQGLEAFMRNDLSMIDVEEFRLRVGFIHAPLPFAGCAHHDDIVRIGGSEEMAPWRIGGTYDRPIPRRIAEEAGVPRAAFGQRKRVMSRAVPLDRGLRWYLGDHSFTVFKSFVADRRGLSDGPLRIAGSVALWCNVGLGTIEHRLGRHTWRGRRLVAASRGVLASLVANGEGRARLFEWGVSRTIARYSP